MTASSSAPRPTPPHWWQWPTVLSLDAPAIVVAWQAIVADVGGVTVHWPERLVLAISVWLAYTIDRWIEAGRLEDAAVSTSRHRFHQRWRWPVAIAALLVLAIDLGVAVILLGTDDIALGMVVAAAAATYVLSHQWLHREAPLRVPKEICVALLLGAGVWLFTRAGAGLPYWTSLGLFTLLGVANTALISRWEADVDRRHGQSSLALAFPRAPGHIRWFPWTVLVVAFVATVVVPIARPIAACAALSAVLLIIIDATEPRTGWQAARVLADGALLTPVLILVAA